MLFAGSSHDHEEERPVPRLHGGHVDHRRLTGAAVSLAHVLHDADDGHRFTAVELLDLYLRSDRRVAVWKVSFDERCVRDRDALARPRVRIREVAARDETRSSRDEISRRDDGDRQLRRVARPGGAPDDVIGKARVSSTDRRHASGHGDGSNPRDETRSLENVFVDWDDSAAFVLRAARFGAYRNEMVG